MSHPLQTADPVPQVRRQRLPLKEDRGGAFETRSRTRFCDCFAAFAQVLVLELLEVRPLITAGSRGWMRSTPRVPTTPWEIMTIYDFPLIFHEKINRFQWKSMHFHEFPKPGPELAASRVFARIHGSSTYSSLKYTTNRRKHPGLLQVQLHPPRAHERGGVHDREALRVHGHEDEDDGEEAALREGGQRPGLRHRGLPEGPTGAFLLSVYTYTVRRFVYVHVLPLYVIT